MPVGVTVKQPTCSRACGAELQRRNRPPKTVKYPTSKVHYKDCLQCGKLFISRHARKKLCTTECKRARTNAQMLEYMNNRYSQVRPRIIDRVHRERTKHIEIPADHINIHALCERDNWECKLCGEPVKRFEECDKRDPLSPSIDHIVPITMHGPHILGNVQLAHLRCNIQKGNRVDKDAANAFLTEFIAQYA